MYITNSFELQAALKPKLREYLESQGVEINAKRYLRCYVHDEQSPSMLLNHVDSGDYVFCFACQVRHDIFQAAAHFEKLPSFGPEFVTVTIPTLAKRFKLTVETTQASIADLARLEQRKLVADVARILDATRDRVEPYAQQRLWNIQQEQAGSISVSDLIRELEASSWPASTLKATPWLTDFYFGQTKYTFAIKDHNHVPVAFISRNMVDKPKYVNSPESIIYQKKDLLFGLNMAKNKLGAGKTIYVVESIGDLFSLRNIGALNVVATCGTALTVNHINLLKSCGVKAIRLCMNWDAPGQETILRLIKNILPQVDEISYSVVQGPADMDVNDFLMADPEAHIEDLPVISTFEFQLSLSEEQDVYKLCETMAPLIAVEPIAIRREFMITKLSEKTGVSALSIGQDVESIRNNVTEERHSRIRGSVQKFISSIEDTPDESLMLIGRLESDIENIDKEFNKKTIGTSYQLDRYDSLQEKRLSDEENSHFEFKMNRYKAFQEAMSGGLTWAEGTLIYVGGRQNSGKTSVCIAFGLDVCLEDEDAIVLMHFTDDSYPQLEPRIKSNIATLIAQPGDAALTIGQAANPVGQITTTKQWDLYNRADAKFRELLAEERLIIIDNQDGGTLTVLEKNLRYVRQRHPGKKLLLICDNTHNYLDYLELDSTERIKRISGYQKTLTGKYRCCMIATAEYRKNGGGDYSKLRLPVDDDLADARALGYQPNAIIHVYNDLNDRREYAEFYWRKEGVHEHQPQLMLIISKNKISAFKENILLNLDKKSVTLDVPTAQINPIKTDWKKNENDIVKNRDEQ